MSYKTQMNGNGESYSGVVPARQPNEGLGGPQEVVEGRPLTKENTEVPNSYRTRSRGSEQTGWTVCVKQRRRIRKYGSLLHHVNLELLRSSYYSLKKRAAAGVDGMTWKEYGEDLEVRLADLHGRIHRGAYRAKPSRRVWILKDDKATTVGNREDDFTMHFPPMALRMPHESCVSCAPNLGAFVRLFR